MEVKSREVDLSESRMKEKGEKGAIRRALLQSQSSAQQRKYSRTSSAHIINHCKNVVMDSENDVLIDTEFYSQLKEYLRSGNISQYFADKRRDFIVERAKNYKLENGEIMLGDKIVIIEAEERRRLLSTVHVNPKSGIHSGAEAMFASVKEHFFWGSMQTEIDTYVKNCSQCTTELANKDDAANAAVNDIIPVEKPLIHLEKSPNTCISVSTPISQTNTNAVGTSVPLTIPPIQSLILNFGVWNLIELKLLRLLAPSPKYLVALSDPMSKWMDVTSLLPEDLISNCVDFLCRHLAILGFTQFHLVGFSVTEQQQFMDIFFCRYRSLTDLEWPYKNASTLEMCPWVQQMLNNFDVNRLEMEVFMYRHKPLPELNGNSPNGKVLLHPRKILGHRLKGPSELEIQVESCFSLQPTTDELLGVGENLDKNAVEAIQLHVEDAKEKRTKKARIKFSMGLKRAITMYASKHGNADTAQFFSKKIGQPITSSRVRIICKRYIELCSKYSTKNKTSNRVVPSQEPVGNIQKSSSKDPCNERTADEKSKARTRKPKQTFSKEMRTKIAEYAVRYGNRDTIRYFKATMDIEISYSTIRYIKSTFLNKRPMVEVLEEQMRMLNNQPLCGQSTS